jgi:ribonuclease HI
MLDQERPRIILLWVPSHKGIPSNEKADQTAKKALDEDILTTVRYPPGELKKWLTVERTSKKETKDGKTETTR